LTPQGMTVISRSSLPTRSHGLKGRVCPPIERRCVIQADRVKNVAPQQRPATALLLKSSNWIFLALRTVSLGRMLRGSRRRPRVHTVCKIYESRISWAQNSLMRASLNTQSVIAPDRGTKRSSGPCTSIDFSNESVRWLWDGLSIAILKDLIAPSLYVQVELWSEWEASHNHQSTPCNSADLCFRI
jgi:hypothetical protein